MIHEPRIERWPLRIYFSLLHSVTKRRTVQEVPLQINPVATENMGKIPTQP